MLQSNRVAVQQIVMSSGVLTPDNSTLAELIGARKALYVWVGLIMVVADRSARASLAHSGRRAQLAAELITLSPEDTDTLRARVPVVPHLIPNGWDDLPAPEGVAASLGGRR
jgi:hypothetical protein